MPAEERLKIPPEERLKIEEAIPAKALVAPGRPRKLLIFDLNVGYGGHRSIPHANLAFTRMGEKTGAFATVVSRDPSVFKRENLKQFDAVFFNNTVGNLFEAPELRQSLVEFVYAGGGLLGVHGTSVAFTRWPGAHEDWPEFGIMLGARGASHRDSDEHVFIKLDDPRHPLNQPFGGGGFDYRDEFFRVHEPYSRDRVRVLLSIDTEKTDMNQGIARGNCLREDNDYALAWVRRYGRGRVFYSTIAHNPYVFWDPKMLRFYLGAVQFALGDLPAPTTPSSKVTPATRAREKLGWRLGMPAYSRDGYTLFQTIDIAAQFGLSCIGSRSSRKVSQEIFKDFDHGLGDDELKQIRLKLDAAGVRLLTYYVDRMPGDETGWPEVFEFGRKMGIETFIAEPPAEALDTIERLCDEYDINLAIRIDERKSSPRRWAPQRIVDVCQGRSKRIGAYGDPGAWMRADVDPIRAAKTLGNRLMTLSLDNLDALGGQGYGPVPWGAKTEQFVRELHRLGIKPTMFSLHYPHQPTETIDEDLAELEKKEAESEKQEIAQTIDFFEGLSLKLAK